MRVIYVDVLAGVNLAMDYLLLAAVARLSGAYCTRPRLLDDCRGLDGLIVVVEADELGAQADSHS